MGKQRVITATSVNYNLRLLKCIFDDIRNAYTEIHKLFCCFFTNKEKVATLVNL